MNNNWPLCKEHTFNTLEALNQFIDDNKLRTIDIIGIQKYEGKYIIFIY